MANDTDWKTIHCTGCDIRFQVPHGWWLDKYQTGTGFRCPNGCQRAYQETEADRVRRERDRLQQRLAEKDDQIADERAYAERIERSRRAIKGQLTKHRMRAQAGICPCCKRTFENLQRHMASKHPDFAPADPPLEVIEGGKRP